MTEISEKTSSTLPEVYSVLEGRREEQPLKAGRRKLIKRGDSNPLTYVEKGNITGNQFCEQEFRKGASSYIWKEYEREKIPAIGVLLDNNILIWFPILKKTLSLDNVIKTARERHIDSQVAVIFRFGEKQSGIFTPEMVISSKGKNFDTFLDPVVNYLGRSLGWKENVKTTVYKGDKGEVGFQGSLSEYLSIHPSVL